MDLRQLNDDTYSEYENWLRENVDIYDYEVVVDIPGEELFKEVIGYRIDHQMKRIILHTP